MGDNVAEDDEPGGTPVGEALLHGQIRCQPCAYKTEEQAEAVLFAQ